MNVHRFHEAPPEWLGEALERFERQFTYPLGNDGRFSISHGRAYLPFFAAMGKATLLVTESGGEVLGTLARVERWIRFAGKDSIRQLVHYLGDLKVSPQARGSRVLARLMVEAKKDILASRSRSCYSIVMNGTGRLPTDYTGRLEVPAFEPLAEIVVLRISAGAGRGAEPKSAVVLVQPGCVVMSGRREMRSLMQPVQITGSAWLEDTRRGKRLWTDRGDEMLSAHLSGFYFEDPAHGAAIIRAAMQEVEVAKMKAMFVAVPQSVCASLTAELADWHIQESPATIYGVSINQGHDWWVDTAEI